MSKKVLVFEDWGDFVRELDIIDKSYEPVQLIQAIKNKLLDCELKNVIEFEAKIYKTGDSDVNRITIPEEVRAKLTEDEKYQAFVVKKGKKHEKDTDD